MGSGDSGFLGDVFEMWDRLSRWRGLGEAGYDTTEIQKENAERAHGLRSILACALPAETAWKARFYKLPPPSLREEGGCLSELVPRNERIEIHA